MFLGETTNTSVDEVQLTSENSALLDEMFKAIDSDDNVLNEATKRQSKSTITKRKVTRAANMLAKQSGDPLYAKMSDLYTRLMDVRSTLLAKYSSKATQIVKQKS